MPDARATLAMDPTSATARILAAVTRRLLTAAGVQALTAGLLLATAVAVGASMVGEWRAALWVGPALAGLGLASVIVGRAWRMLTPLHVATMIERRWPRLDNLLVTTIELESRARPAHPLVLRELRRQTDARIQSLDASRLVPLTRPITLAAVIAFGAVVALLGVTARGGVPARSGSVVDTNAHAGVDAQQPTLHVTVIPPAYAGQPTQTLRDVAEVEALEGSRVRLEVEFARGDVQLIEAGQPTLTFQKTGARASTELIAERTRFLIVRMPDASAASPANQPTDSSAVSSAVAPGVRAEPGAKAEAPGVRAEAPGAKADRLVAVVVKPDAAPIVRIRQPARDLLFAQPRGRVPIEIEATDDLGLGAVSLRYTRVFGAGENVQFQEGDLPLHIEKAEPGRWRATSEISLEGLQLADGDTLVYRATTRDLRPGRDPSASESYLLEVGKLAQVATAGFALPEDKDRQALSQQMVIMKTERLHQERDRLPRAEYEDRARGLAIEQRMVRAEFVFMTGGEVEDEVAEAEQSHDLAEGRFQNEGQVELLTAIREMSRAEARLNDVATGPALELERLALKALQRAFDRRRYLLRTMPERARIDQTRRLTGELANARSWRRAQVVSSDDRGVQRLVMLAQELAAAKQNGAGLAALGARVGALDPESTELQKAALALSAAASAFDPERSAIIDDTMRLLADRARRALTSSHGWIPHDPSAGRYADALAQQGAKR